MLKNTLIVPETDARLAARLVQEAIDTLDIVLMFVFGKDDQAKQTVEWADQLCNKTRISDTFNIRKVIWIRNAAPATLRTVLNSFLGDKPVPRVAALNFHDQLKGTIPEGGEIDPIKLEMLFVEAQKT